MHFHTLTSWQQLDWGQNDSIYINFYQNRNVKTLNKGFLSRAAWTNMWWVLSMCRHGLVYIGRMRPALYLGTNVHGILYQWLLTQKASTKRRVKIRKSQSSFLWQWEMTFVTGFLGMQLHGTWWMQTSCVSWYLSTHLETYCFRSQVSFQMSNSTK